MESLRLKFTVRILIAILALLVSAGTADAIESKAKEALLLDMSTGSVLYEKKADELMAPASMSKLMTVYMVFERLQDGRLSMDDEFTVSENAWRRGGAKSGSSTMFLEPNSRVRVEDLLRGIIVQSGNDACIVVAEALGGSEEAFAEEMTRRARELGMLDSTFRNATGWPHPEHRVTPRDLALLAKLTIENFPDYFHFYGEKNFTYNGIRQSNRNPLLYKNIGADGLKTGHTEESGYGLVATAKRGGRRLILVINGLKSVKARSRESERLIEWGFREFSNYKLFGAGDEVSRAAAWLGVEAHVPMIIQDELVLTLPRRARREMKAVIRYSEPIPTPIAKGQKLADLVVMAPGFAKVTRPLVAGVDVKQLGLFGRLAAALGYMVWGAETY